METNTRRNEESRRFAPGKRQKDKMITEEIFQSILEIRSEIKENKWEIEDEIIWNKITTANKAEEFKLKIDTDLGGLINIGAIPTSRIELAFAEKYNANTNKSTFINTDGSKMEDKISNGTGIIIDYSKKALTTSYLNAPYTTGKGN